MDTGPARQPLRVAFLTSSVSSRVHELSEDFGGYEHRTGNFGDETLEIFQHPGGRIIAVEGHPVR